MPPDWREGPQLALWQELVQEGEQRAKVRLGARPAKPHRERKPPKQKSDDLPPLEPLPLTPAAKKGDFPEPLPPIKDVS